MHGSYYVGFYIDPNNLAAEMLETNNEVHSQMNVVDRYESDNTSAQAKQLIINGNVQTHSFVPASESDWVYFVVSQVSDLTITASLLVPSNLDPNFEIYDANLVLQFIGDQPGEEVAYGNSISPGVFYLRIYQGGAVNGGAYTIRVTSP